MKLLPKKVVNLILLYNCGKCGSEYWVNKEEACVSGFRFVCSSCKQVNEIEPIKIKHTVYPLFVQKTEKYITVEIDTNGLITIMSGYGYTRKEAKNLIEEAVETLKNKGLNLTKENVIQYAFAHAK
jgi:DNA-directed RNA polymerase subunit M/transcription elongation factor TFIIS